MVCVVQLEDDLLRQVSILMGANIQSRSRMAFAHNLFA